MNGIDPPGRRGGQQAGKSDTSPSRRLSTRGPPPLPNDRVVADAAGAAVAEDQAPSPAQVAEFEQALKASGKTYEFHSYEGAGHGFFAADRPSYRAEAAADGHTRILTWLGRYLEG